MKTRAVGLSDVGRKRDRNEDAMLVDEELGVYAVADGMGGHAAGHVASRRALDVVHQALKAQAKVIADVAAGTAEPYKLLMLAEKAVGDTCQAVYRLAKQNPEYSGMGCTLTLLVVANRRGVVAHVGDTRLYLFRDGDVDQLSTDHTLTHELKQRGMPTAARQYEHVLTRSIGQQELVQVDTLAFDVQADDILLICSDGLHDHLQGPADLSRFLAGREPESISRKLVDYANERGGDDNITAVTVRVEASDAEQEEALELSSSARQRISALRQVDLFKNLPFSELFRILSASSVKKLAAKETVVRAGDICDQLFIVTKGNFELQPEIGDFTLTLKPGDHMGDTMLLVKRACRATMVAKADGEVLVLGGEEFRDLAAQRPWVGMTMMMRLARALSIEFADISGTLSEQPSSAQRSSRLFF
jgi:serine/threonine protein phosphatase PrpC